MEPLTLHAVSGKLAMPGMLNIEIAGLSGKQFQRHGVSRLKLTQALLGAVRLPDLDSVLPAADVVDRHAPADGIGC